MLVLAVVVIAAGAAGKNKPARVLTVAVVADQNYARQTGWEQKARAIIEQAAGAIDSTLGIQLRIVRYQLWRHRDEADLFRLATLLVDTVSRDSVDCLIGFTLFPRPPETTTVRTDGVTVPFAGIMIRTYQGTSDRNMFAPHVLLHEMVHFFGGVHVPGRTLMAPISDNLIVSELDPVNRQIIELTHDIDFSAGCASLSPLQLESLAGIYERQATDGHNNLAAYGALGDIYRELGKFDQATAVFQRLRAIDATSAFIRGKLADSYEESGRTDSAIACLEEGADRSDEPGLLYRRLATLYYTRGDIAAARRYAWLALGSGHTIDPALKKALADDTLLPNQK